jgi:hypothetical protein
MINKDFYPTPESVILQMNLDVVNRIVYDPSAGSGNILDWCKSNGAKRTIGTEIEPKLKSILKVNHELIKDDFLQVQSADISHVNLIAMNPPFSADVRHILHAYEIAPKGCEIVALCNFESLNNDYSRQRKELLSLIRDYGTSQNLGSVFIDAERKTNVQIGLIRLFKAGTSEDFGEYFTMEEDEDFGGINGILPHNQVREVVQRYVQSLILFDEFENIRLKMNETNKHLNLEPFKVSVNYNDNIVTRENFMVELQKRSWEHVFSLMKMNKYLTKGVKEDLNKFVEENKKYPFTMKNIFKVLEIVVGTRENQLSKALVEAVDNYTKHTHENRYSVQGWKTNSGYMINKKIIIDYMVEHSYRSGMSIREYGRTWDMFDDLLKVLCFLTGKNYDTLESIKYAPCTRVEGGYLTVKGEVAKNYRNQPYNDNILNYNEFHTNTWYKWEFFEFKVFKKGTMHIKFTDLKAWEMLNRKYAEIKGFTLPENF